MREFNLADNYEEVSPEWILAIEEPETKKTFRDLYPLSGFRVMEDGRITEVNNISPQYYSYELWNTLPTKEEAEAYKILPMLLHFRDRYNEGWKPNWEINIYKYTIVVIGDNLSVSYTQRCSSLFAFKNAEIRDRFLEDFREELEIVKPLL